MSQLRPWRSHDRSNTLTDRAVVAFLADEGPARPRDIARSRYRENVIRLQCRYLVDAGLIDRVATDTFDAASTPNEGLSDGDWLPDDRIETADTRIDGFGEIDGRLLRAVNRRFLARGEYGLVRGDRGETRRRIDGVTRYRIDRVLREFPYRERRCRQCAHWMRAFAGLHFFPDANHRTALATLYAVLDQNGIAPPTDEWPFEWIGHAVSRCKLLRSLHSQVTFASLWERDELYYHWLRYFVHGFLDVDRESRNERPRELLDGAVDYVRRQRRP